MDVERIARAINPRVFAELEHGNHVGTVYEFYVRTRNEALAAAVRVQELLREDGVLDAVEKVEAVRVMHTPQDWPFTNADGSAVLYCRACQGPMPCATLKALDGSGVPK